MPSSPLDVCAEQQGSWTKAAAVQDPGGNTVHSISLGEGIKEHPLSPKDPQKGDDAGGQSGELRFADDTDQQTAAGEARRNSELDKNGAVLAERLGTQAAVFLDSSFGVELILEKN